MAHETRSYANKSKANTIGTGILLGKVVSVLDPTFNGKLKVTILRHMGNDPKTESQTYLVSPAFPFFGYTPFEAMGNNNEDFNDTQKSYGMWFVPPDIGVTVMCAFVDGDPSQGYWFACVPPSFANHMVPAIAGTTEVAITDADRKKYDTKQPLPTGDINKRFNTRDNEPNPEKIKKPVHPIADRFLEQGTLDDDVRGVTTTTSRRQNPNSVFGISTPGPLDKRSNAKRMVIGAQESESPIPIPVSRLGGTQFVIDDGDERFLRKTSASDGPVDYADVAAGEKGNVEIPYNEYTRIRTRTGHQLLFHNSEDLIYVGNSKGTAWIELTSNGKIDIYAADSISIHSENDLNIKADRDINIEAGRNVNMKATAEYQSENVLHRKDDSGNPIPKIQDDAGIESGRIQIESAFNTNILIGANGKIETRTYENAAGTPTTGSLDINVAGNTRIEQFLNLDIKTGQRNSFTAGANTEILSTGQHIETASQIHMNGPQARTADDANTIEDLITHANIVTNTAVGWNQNKRYQEGLIRSIMKRVPMHEPWALHENLAPGFFTPASTDREIGEEE